MNFTDHVRFRRNVPFFFCFANDGRSSCSPTGSVRVLLVYLVVVVAMCRCMVLVATKLFFFFIDLRSFFFETPFLFSLSYRDPCRFYFYFCKLAYSSPPVCFRIRRKILSKQQTQSAAWPFFPPLFVRVCVFQLAGALLFLFSLFLSAFFYLFHFLLLIMELSSSASCNAFTPPQAHPISTSACRSLSRFICDLESS